VRLCLGTICHGTTGQALVASLVNLWSCRSFTCRQYFDTWQLPAEKVEIVTGSLSMTACAIVEDAKMHANTLSRTNS